MRPKEEENYFNNAVFISQFKNSFKNRSEPNWFITIDSFLTGLKSETWF